MDKFILDEVLKPERKITEEMPASESYHVYLETVSLWYTGPT